MLWVKSFHIVFIASWFAGLFYLPRIFVNLAMVPPESVAERERLMLMAEKLFRFTTMLAVPALALGLWLESERMLHAKVEKVGIETQRQVVKEERRQRIDNQPYGRLLEETMKRTFLTHPYKSSVIGSMDHLDAAKEEDYVNFYKSFYRPDNAIMSIAGDIDIAQTKQLIDAYLKDIPRRRSA